MRSIAGRPASIYQPLPQLKGRGPQLRLLENALRECSGGRLRLVLLSGPAGIGKSAVVRNFAASARRATAQVLVAECTEQDSTRPFGPLLQLAGDALADQTVNSATGLQFEEQRRRVAIEIAKGLQTRARERPVVLVLEDLQWSDPETLQLLPYLARRARDSALMIVATLRTGDEGSETLATPIARLRRDAALELELPPLTPNDVGMLVSSTLGPAGRPDTELVAFVAEHSGGNPLLVEELLRGLAERRWLVLSGGVWQAVRSLTPAVLPTTIGESARARLASVPEVSRKILSTAAVLGQRFTFDLLLEITGRRQASVVAALRAGIDLQLIEESAPDGTAYAFRHALLRDALLRDLIGPERQEIHRAVAFALEKATPNEERSAIAAELAYHFEAADDPARAVRYHLLSVRGSSPETGTWLANLSPNARVAIHLRKALALAPGDHPDRAEMLRVYAWAQDDPGQRLPIIEQSLAHARATGDRRGVALATVIAGAWRAMQGDQSGVPTIREGIRLLVPLGPSADLAEAHFQLSRIATLAADAKAISLAERAVELARTHGGPALLAHSLATLGTALVTDGRSNGVGVLREALALARARSPVAVSRTLENLWNALLASGASDDEIRQVEREIDAEHLDSWIPIASAFIDGNWSHAIDLADAIPFLPLLQHPTTPLICAYVRVAREGPSQFLPDVLSAHRRVEKSPLLRGSPLAPEILYLAGEHQAALDTAGYVVRCMERVVPIPFIDMAATSALAAAVALHDDRATDEWLERCQTIRDLEARTGEGRTAYARGESAVRAGRTSAALNAFAESARGFDQRGATLLARTLPRLRSAELLVDTDVAAAQRELARVIAMWRAVDARWYLARLREWAAARGLRGWTVSARRGPGLTPRELEVAHLVAEGLTNREIGMRLDITERTAETHVQRVVTKLNLRGRVQLAAWIAGGAGGLGARA